ncbi:MAG: metallophosphoesterase [Planctomycetota bacterium]
MRRGNAPATIAALLSMGLAWSCSNGGGSRGGGSSTAPASTTSRTTTTNPPVTNPPATSNPVVSGDVLVPYAILDPQSQPHSIAADYTTDAGVTWKPCAQGQGGDPTTNLSSSPAGVAHTFSWDSLKDLGAALVPNVQIRITPSGQAPGVSPAVDVDNRALQKPTANVTFERGPYVQGTTQTSIKVIWRTTQPTDTVVEYAKGTTLTNTLKAGNPSASETTHLVTLTGLTAGTAYTYRILTGGQVATYPTPVSTAPDASVKTFTALVFGDSGKANQNQYDLATRMAAEKFDLVLHTGDVTYPVGAEAEYNPGYFVPYGPFIKSIPVFPAMGNHDLMTANGQAYMDAFHPNANNPANDKRYYSFEWADAKFVSIESYALFKAAGPHLDWLKNELASNTRRWLVVYMHVPLYSVGYHGDNATLQNLLQPIFEQYKVDLVLQGHDHNYERMSPVKKYSTDPNWQGVPFIVTGGGGADIYPTITNHTQTVYKEAMNHYTLLTFFNDAIRGKVIRKDGTTAEAFTINHQ